MQAAQSYVPRRLPVCLSSAEGDLFCHCEEGDTRPPFCHREGGVSRPKQSQSVHCPACLPHIINPLLVQKHSLKFLL